MYSTTYPGRCSAASSFRAAPWTSWPRTCTWPASWPGKWERPHPWAISPTTCSSGPRPRDGAGTVFPKRPRFWSSWQVFLHVFETVRDLTHNKHYQSREDSDRSNLLARIEGPRYFLLKEISLYVSEQLTADLGHQEASSRQEAFPRSVDNKKAADRVREHIDKSGLTQTQFAGKAGMTDRTLRKFLKTGRIKRNKLDDIAKAINTSPTELLQD